MTVAIAARCAQGRAIIAMTDRQVTIGDWELKAEQPLGKGFYGPNGWTVLYAGDATCAEAVVARAITEWNALDPAKQPTFQIGMLKHIHQTYLKHHHDVIDMSVLQPRGLNLEIWQERVTSKDFDPGFRAEIMKEIDDRDEDVGCDLLACGFDTNGEGHILTVGLRHEADDNDWAAIGTGGEIAQGRLAWQGTNFFDPLPRALYEVYEAAAHASQNPAVGQNLSAVVLTGNGEDGTHDVPKTIMDLLEAAFRNHDHTPFRNALMLRDDGERPVPHLIENWEQSLMKWADTILPPPGSAMKPDQ